MSYSSIHKIALTFLLTVTTFESTNQHPSETLLKLPVTCHGLVPKISEGKYYFHDNDSYNLRLTTNVKLTLDLYHRSCFEVDLEIDNESNEENPSPDLNKTAISNDSLSDNQSMRAQNDKINHDQPDSQSINRVKSMKKIKSLFYAVEYKSFQEEYPIRGKYTFGIPEFQTKCQCDCPQGTQFCTPNNQRGGHSDDINSCNGSPHYNLCLTLFYANKRSTGCLHEGSSSLCCTIAIRPFENRRYTAIRLGQPAPSVDVRITIYALYLGRWSVFRQYDRKVMPYKGNYLHLNGYENVADMFIFAKASNAQFRLTSKLYHFQDKTMLDGFHFRQDVDEVMLPQGPSEDSGVKKIDLLESDSINDLHDGNMENLGSFRWIDNRWQISNAATKLKSVYQPVVANCQDQKYLDSFDMHQHTYVIRNSSGGISASPFDGYSVIEREKFVLSTSVDHLLSALLVSHNSLSAPTLMLDLALRQKINVVSHLHASYILDFRPEIRLDKYANRFLNITLIQAYGAFSIKVYRNRKNVDVMLSLSTNLPFTKNYTDILPLPNHISSSRLVCVHPLKKPKQEMCKFAEFNREKLLHFKLKHTFVENVGVCEGCNKDDDVGNGGFWEKFNPKTWLNGINSIPEAIAAITQILIIAVIAILLIILFRRCFLPLLKCALSSKGKKYSSSDVNYDKMSKCNF